MAHKEHAPRANKQQKVLVICGSVRTDSMTRHAMALVVDELKKRGADPYVFDPVGISVPYLGASFAMDLKEDLQARARHCDGIILCTPEYNGSFSSVLMAIIENLGYPASYAGKVCTLLGVAAGGLGAIKSLEHLRNVLFHNGAVVLPSSVSISHVNLSFDKKGQCTDPKTEGMIRSVGSSLMDYLETGKVTQVGVKKL